MKNRIIALALILAMLLMATGCGMFSAAEPSQPDVPTKSAGEDEVVSVPEDTPEEIETESQEVKDDDSFEEAEPEDTHKEDEDQQAKDQAPSNAEELVVKPEKPTIDESETPATPSADKPSVNEKPKTCAHTYSKQVVSPTCTEAGYTIHKCMKCGETYTDNEVAALGHIPYCKEIAPNCTTPGKKLYTCTRCEKLIKTETFGNALGHSFASTSYETQPSCESCGTRTYACQRAGCTEKYTENFGKALGHDFSGAPSVTAATCTSPEKKVYYCSRCNKTKSESGAAALGHDYQAVNKTSTSVEWPHVYDVTTTGYVCSRCGTTDTSRPNSTNRSLHVYDVNAAMAYGNNYALSLGFGGIDYSLTLNNAAYFPYDIVKAASVAEFGGLEYFVQGQVSATAEMINVRFAPETVADGPARVYVEYRPATDDYIVACLYA